MRSVSCFTVVDTFYVPERGFVLITLQKHDATLMRDVRVGDNLEIRSENCVATTTEVLGVEFMLSDNVEQQALGILVSLPQDFSQSLRGATAEVITTSRVS